ncbi:MAG TPA: helix-turn-helix transcriptional regulator [Rhodanobacteraceae bacterium]
MGNLQALAPASRDASAVGRLGFGVWRTLSTRAVAPRERFDFCRELPTGSHLERPLDASGDFRAEFRYITTPDGIDFGVFDIDACVSRFGPGDDDACVDIGLINAGSMRIRHGRDQTLALRAGMAPALFDPARPMTTRTSRSDMAYLRLPRAAVVAAVGGDAVPRGMAVRPLGHGALTVQLAALLRGVQRGSTQRATAVIDALQTARALALVALAGVRGAGHHWPDALDAALYRAACHQLLRQAANSRATADTVANVLGCSRAQLYRLFAAHGESVARRLRELRMQRAAELLTARPHAAVASIASRCGYGEPIAFDRAFRRRFGMTPSDWRAAHTAPRGASI